MGVVLGDLFVSTAGSYLSPEKSMGGCRMLMVKHKCWPVLQKNGNIISVPYYDRLSVRMRYLVVDYHVQ